MQYLLGFRTICMQLVGQPKFIGASLSEPHTSVTALRTCVCMSVCLSVCGHINGTYNVRNAAYDFSVKLSSCIYVDTLTVAVLAVGLSCVIPRYLLVRDESCFVQ